MSAKGLIRSLDRRGVDSRKGRPEETQPRHPAEPTLCDRCGAMYAKRTWRTDHAPSPARLARARWRTCPACLQVAAGEWRGRIRLEGGFVAQHDDDIRRRITNVARRAIRTQPERRVVSVEPLGGGLEVLTTSQKLAHRIVHELRKAFRGQATYRWSDDRTLEATWRREAAAARRVRS